MKRTYIILLSLFAIAAIAGFIGYNYVMHGGARDLSQEETNYSVTSTQITDDFTHNIASANKKYLEKAVAVKGIVSEINGNQIIIDKNIICNLKAADPKIKLNHTVVLKGRVVGFDDFMGEIKLDQCFTL